LTSPNYTELSEGIKLDYEPLRNKFITYIFALMRQGVLHRKIEGEELDLYLSKYFGGFPLLIRFQKI